MHVVPVIDEVYTLYTYLLNRITDPSDCYTI